MNTGRRRLLGVLVVGALVMGVAAPAAGATRAGAPTSVPAKKKKKPKSTTTTKPTTVAACKLLTVAEITAAVGIAPTEPPKTSGQDECDYSATDYYNFLNMSWVGGMTKPLFALRVKSLGPTAIAVSGVGDEAFETPNGATILARKGEQAIRIDLYPPGLDPTVAQKLAKTALSRR